MIKKPYEITKEKIVQHEIVVVSHGFQTNYERGFINGLASNVKRVTLISSDKTDINGLRSNVSAINLRGSQSELRCYFMKLANIFKYHVKLLKKIIISRGCNVHVIGMIEPVFFLGVVEGCLLRLLAGKYILTVHNVLPHSGCSKIKKYFYRLAYHAAHFLIVHTEQMAKELACEFSIPRQRLVVMEHGIEPFYVKDGEKRYSSDGRVRILFFGRISDYKGLDILLDALEPLKGRFTLNIVGRCLYDKERVPLLSRINEHSAKEDIVWRDEYIHEDEVSVIFEETDLLVLPYRHIYQSGVLFQSLRYGVPIVASDVGALKQYISPDVGLVFEKNNVHDLTTKICYMLDNLHLYSRRNIQQYAKRFEWDAVSARIIALYQ